jgi:opacity protein-like surface antigen
MKKILITAASIAVLTTGVAAHADHNYVGLGLGWTFAKAQTKGAGNVVCDTDQPFPIKSMAKDNGIAGKLIVGHSFGQSASSVLLEASIGLDSTTAKVTSKKTFNDAGLGDFEDTSTISLKRKGIFGLSVGLSTSMIQDINGYAKVSLLLSRFQIKHSSSVSPDPADAHVFFNYSQKAKTKWGFGLTVGASKPLTDSLSLGLDYSFEMFQKVKFKGETYSRDGLGSSTYSGSMNPAYHAITVTLSQKF